MIEIVGFKNRKMVLLDQRVIPQKVRYKKFKNSEEAAWAIKVMVVRGAPAIGIAAAYGYVLGCIEKKISDKKLLDEYMKEVKVRLFEARPTAVNLQWALDRMEQKYNSLGELGQEEIFIKLLEEADIIKESEIQANISMGDYGAEEFKRLMKDNKKLNILTHCNAGALATGGWGTALGVIRSAFDNGIIEKVYADETRPRLQGARLTCFELKEHGIPYKLICDNMSGLFMKNNRIDAIVVGADRIAANGDVANKIGTYMVAVLANRHNIPFYVAAPRSTFDFNTATGDDIEIEQRSIEEVLYIKKRSISPQGTQAENPAFDVTPQELVTGYITEEGVIRHPDELQ
jgi:methylthioribose-1-phosphate isomerase